MMDTMANEKARTGINAKIGCGRIEEMRKMTRGK